jgi:hypothetical protein
MDACKSVDPPLIEVERNHWVDCLLYPKEYREAQTA